ncbi:hypothetical protein HPB50_004606 [Hyalomma asiaticum]|uniref:Uncharacterized protein n=1 Tax=Hyalomma asiaticum TaxID=266040 RepID=A0ACB7TIQ3_HYAAI|nr:hypothetical protein HPB50_004606 [Hyalomma asiaticum]
MAAQIREKSDRRERRQQRERDPGRALGSDSEVIVSASSCSVILVFDPAAAATCHDRAPGPDHDSTPRDGGAAAAAAAASALSEPVRLLFSARASLLSIVEPCLAGVFASAAGAFKGSPSAGRLPPYARVNDRRP